MYRFLLGVMTGFILNFLIRKLMDSDSISLILEALKPAKLPFSKPRHGSAPAAPTEPSGDQVKSVAAR